MSRRVSALQDVEIAISRDVDSRYGDVKLVADNMDAIIKYTENTTIKTVAEFPLEPIVGTLYIKV